MNRVAASSPRFSDGVSDLENGHSYPMNRIWTSVLPLMLSVLLAACGNLGYYAQAIGGHLDIMGSTHPIRDIIGDPASDPGLRKKLQDVQAIRDFASRELGLPDNNSYRTYADVGRPFVVWNVFAVPEFSLHPKQWCLLIVGCVSYRGYYDKHDAERLAAELRQEGYDTVIGGIPAYSTLGYLDDPVLNTILRRGTTEVAHIVFHELAHQLLYVKDDSQFNESFATAVENEGMRRWLAGHATSEQRAAFETQQNRRAAFAELMREYLKKFYALYSTTLPVDQQRQAKAELLGALRQRYADLKLSWNGYTGYDAFFGEDLNNARLASMSLYSELVPAFEVLLERQNQDLPQFYQSVAALAALGKEARSSALTLLLPAANKIHLARGQQLGAD
jgi:predicted aminopeptidase